MNIITMKTSTFTVNHDVTEFLNNRDDNQLSHIISVLNDAADENDLNKAEIAIDSLKSRISAIDSLSFVEWKEVLLKNFDVDDVDDDFVKEHMSVWSEFS